MKRFRGIDFARASGVCLLRTVQTRIRHAENAARIVDNCGPCCLVPTSRCDAGTLTNSVQGGDETVDVLVGEELLGTCRGYVGEG